MAQTALGEIEKIAQSRRCEPAYVLPAADTKDLYAAKWRLPAHRLVSGCHVDHLLAYCVHGASAVSKTVDGKTQRKPSRPGVVTFTPSGEQARYGLESNITILELYIPPALLRQFLDHNSTGSDAISPLFAVQDPWLAGYFQMLISEIEMCATEGAITLDSLLVGQAQQLLFRHMLRRYSNVRDENGYAHLQKRSALRPFLLKRVVDFIEAHYATDIRLVDLAALVHLSENHFIRAFYAATGVTPHRYLIEKRLDACAAQLRERNPLPIAELARSAGFRSHAHFTVAFKARFGIPPTRYRDEADA